MFRSALGWILSQYVYRTPLHRGKVRLTKAAFRALPRVPVRGRYGSRMLSVPDNTSVRSIVGTYSPVFECVNRLTEGMAFIDVGANAGVFSLLAADRVGSTGCVVSFEPAWQTFQLLMQNIGLNGSQRIYPFNAAVGADTGVMRFDPSPGHSGKAHISASGSVEVLQIGGAELQPLLGALVGDREVIVKIDVEGAEVLVLEGLAPFLRMAQVVAIVVEVDGEHLARFGATEEDLFGAMDGLGLMPEQRVQSGGHYDQIFVPRAASA